MRVNEEMLAALYDGRCTVYISEPQAAESGWLAGTVRREVYGDVPCHLSLEQAAAGDGEAPAALRLRGTLFIGASYQIPPGSEVVVRQRGAEYRLALSGVPRVYAVHQEIAAVLLDELA